MYSGSLDARRGSADADQHPLTETHLTQIRALPDDEHCNHAQPRLADPLADRTHPTRTTPATPHADGGHEARCVDYGVTQTQARTGRPQRRRRRLPAGAVAREPATEPY
ncbi:hypothetical protein AB0J01_37820 [Streptomyces sp. NPDC050204]|uniref:hypothetical protein n=1 Tax=Streptomyces sp. NPDC050204 TaxID=3155514 RepID=UPI003419C292